MNNYFNKYIKYKTKYNLLKFKGGHIFTKDEFINEMLKLNSFQEIKDFLSNNNISIKFNFNTSDNINHIKTQIIKKYLAILNILPQRKKIIKKYLYVGDSFTRIFDHAKSNEMEVIIYKGRTCSALNKDDNLVSIEIKSKITINTLCIILNFGNVDIHFSYYYELLSNEKDKKKLNTNDDIHLINKKFIDKICNNYFDFILQLLPSDSYIYIINPYYSPIETELLMDTLLSYIFYEPSHHPLHKYETNIENILFSLENRHSLIDMFYNKMNELLANFNNNTKIKLININDYIIDHHTKKIKKEYLIAQDMCDIHLRYNIVVHYKHLLNSCGLKINEDELNIIKQKNKTKYLCPKILYIGDSLIKIFSHEKKFNETILSYSGMRCIQLSDTYHALYEDIKNYIFSHVILNFGSNDLLLDYFYYYGDDINYTDDFINNICSTYLTFIKLLHNDSNIVNIKIIIPYYSPINDMYFYDALKRYNKNNIEFVKNDILYNQNFRNNLVNKFEIKLKELCYALEKIKFINVNNIISIDGYVKDEYRLDDNTDMHFKWKPMIEAHILYK